MADHYVPVPGGPNNQNYANVELILDIAKRIPVQAVWAGWGHASENPKLPDLLHQNDIEFIGKQRFHCLVKAPYLVVRLGLENSIRVPPTQDDHLKIIFFVSYPVYVRRIYFSFVYISIFIFIFIFSTLAIFLIIFCQQLSIFFCKSKPGLDLGAIRQWNATSCPLKIALEYPFAVHEIPRKVNDLWKDSSKYCLKFQITRFMVLRCFDLISA